jgi:PIN domain nuclease of toxin-antitoxin system
VRLLLDTHTFIWWDSDPSQLSAAAWAACKEPTNEVLLSVASLWEIQIKHQLGKLDLRQPLPEIVTHQQTANGLRLLLINPLHVFALNQLPSIHRDPFDRLLIAQANTEDATLVSVDSVFSEYPVKLLW